MLVLQRGSTNAQILEAVRKFVELLAEEKYIEAYEMTYPSPFREWTPELIKALIEGYGYEEPVEGNDESPLRITSLKQMTEPESEQRHQVDWLEVESKVKPRILGGVHYDLPIENEWSDLTAIFDIVEVEGGIALSLYDIHVL